MLRGHFFLFCHFFLSMAGADMEVDMFPMDEETITWRSETSRVSRHKTKGTGFTAASTLEREGDKRQSW